MDYDKIIKLYKWQLDQASNELSILIAKKNKIAHQINYISDNIVATSNINNTGDEIISHLNYTATATVQVKKMQNQISYLNQPIHEKRDHFMKAYIKHKSLNIVKDKHK